MRNEWDIRISSHCAGTGCPHHKPKTAENETTARFGLARGPGRCQGDIAAQEVQANE